MVSWIMVTSYAYTIKQESVLTTTVYRTGIPYTVQLVPMSKILAHQKWSSSYDVIYNTIKFDTLILEYMYCTELC